MRSTTITENINSVTCKYGFNPVKISSLSMLPCHLKKSNCLCMRRIILIYSGNNMKYLNKICYFSINNSSFLTHHHLASNVRTPWEDTFEAANEPTREHQCSLHCTGKMKSFSSFFSKLLLLDLSVSAGMELTRRENLFSKIYDESSFCMKSLLAKEIKWLIAIQIRHTGFLLT